jgi:hypothetical protein
LEPGEQGVIMGALIFEVVTNLIPGGQLKHATKVRMLDDLAVGRVAATSPGGRVMAKVMTLLNKLRTTKMCFIAGTMVMSAQGAVPIEAVRPGMEVRARDEFTQAEGWKPVLQTFTTHPEELFTLGYDTDGDGATDEELTGTGEHPFWVEDLGEFVPMRDLRPGMRLSLAREGATAIVTGNVSKRGPPGERFTTYNFEVADFHTYFVGSAGVWVHNRGLGHCQKVYALYKRYRDSPNAANETPFQTLARMKARMESAPGLGGVRPDKIPSAIWGRASSDIAQGMLHNYSGNLADFPTFNNWKESVFKGTGVLRSHAGVDIHHIVERYIQEMLGIPKDVWNTAPGIPLPRNKKILDDLNVDFDDANKLLAIHKGKNDGGISGLLQSAIPPGNPGGLTPQQVISKLFDVHNDPAHPELHNMWPVIRDWLTDLQSKNQLSSSLSIP